MQVIIDDILTSYQSAGKGKTVLLLHGWGDSSATFKELGTKLAELYQVIAIDLPGFGGTQAPERTWGLSDYATFVSGFINKLGVNPYAVIGHSNGGSIALRGLGENMFTAEKLVLLASAGIRSHHKAKKRVLRLAAKTAKLPVSLLPKSTQSKIKKRAYRTIGSDLFIAEHLQETFKRVVEDDVRADAANIAIPALLIYGARDEATPAAYGQLIKEKITQSRLEVIPDVGHFVHHEAPEETLRLINNFLGEKN